MAEGTEPATRDIAKMNLYQKIARITGDIGVIKKGGRNSEQNYAFIEYAAVAGELRTLFAKYGVVIVPRMQRPDRQHRADITSKNGKAGYYVLIEFHFTIVNADAPDDRFTVSWSGEAADFGDKATNKAATSALKYYLMRQFNISEKGEDADADSPEISTVAPVVTRTASPNKPASEKQIALLTSLAHRKGKDAEWLLSTLEKVRSSADASTVIDKLGELEDAQ
ncbi:ERF family protein [Rathayibacter sp. VKM Ac-2805]|uniref:ERF family protein n=1 Tax=Rathayibacter sp. VKM Ac-2805 TaxID=2609258 RepID=UPI0013203A8F|nr:ERF family protein [Rathayibacter sp. VKM Ac-2805]QHC73797.1 hypothetical protein GSU40_08975 [Rathayibacter sp. VKM Ac-2805]